MKYQNLTQIDHKLLINLLNKNDVRTFLVDHHMFNEENIFDWINEKTKLDSMQKCYIRAIEIEGNLAGWCGIQPDTPVYEIAVILDKKYWGNGKKIFVHLLNKAKELGHKEVVLNLLGTRPIYKSLEKLSHKIKNRFVYADNFTSYYIKL